MDRDTQAQCGPAPGAVPAGRPGRRVVYVCVVVGGALAFLAGLGLVLGTFDFAFRKGYALTLPPAPQFAAGDVLTDLKLFKGWNRPEVVLVLSGEQHGYLQPCGCTSPQYGGLTRRYNLFQALRQRGWPLVAADLGDMNQKSGPQSILKYAYAMKALDLMGYTAVNFGEYECSMPLIEAQGHYWLNNATPRVVNADLLDRQPGGLFNGTVFNWALAEKPAAPRVGIFGLTGKSVEQKIKDPSVRFAGGVEKIVTDCLGDLKKNKAELIVLLYQGDIRGGLACADFCAAAAKRNPSLPHLDVILCLSTASEPPSLPRMEGNTMIVEVGHKGRYVGVVGAFRAKGASAAFELKYQMVSIEPKLDTPPGQEKGHKLMALLEDYTAELKRDDYLSRYKQVSHAVQLTAGAAAYAGSAACQNCHADAFKIWEKSKHAHAYQTLVDQAKNPSLRQFDGECVVCHTVGFGYKTGFESFAKTKFLTDVGCESCHGPCSEHVRKPKDQKMRVAINPLKFRGAGPQDPVAKQARINAIGTFCMKCHDTDNDNRFDIDKYWPKIVHMTKGQLAANNPPK